MISCDDVRVREVCVELDSSRPKCCGTWLRHWLAGQGGSLTNYEHVLYIAVLFVLFLGFVQANRRDFHGVNPLLTLSLFAAFDNLRGGRHER